MGGRRPPSPRRSSGRQRGGQRGLDVAGVDFPGFVDELVGVNGLDVRAATSIALAEYRHDVNLFNELADLVLAQSQFTQGTVLVAASGKESQRDKECDERAT
jgi:hypothetical protein